MIGQRKQGGAPSPEFVVDKSAFEVQIPPQDVKSIWWSKAHRNSKDKVK